MRLNIKAWALSWGLLWGGGLLAVGLLNLVWAGYGQSFLAAMASIYPGYHATPSIIEVVVVTLYGFVDGLIGGAVFGWLYNRLAGSAS